MIDDGFGIFVKLSTRLTGFDEAALLGTGQARAYFDWVRHAAPATFSALLREVDRELHGEDVAAILASAEIGTLAQQITYLWYTAQWRSPWGTGAETVIVSPAAYQEGLVWPAILAHPPGAKQQGFGSWAELPPREGAS
jgi:hypothetical protein